MKYLILFLLVSLPAFAGTTLVDGTNSVRISATSGSNFAISGVQVQSAAFHPASDFIAETGSAALTGTGTVNITGNSIFTIGISGTLGTSSTNATSAFYAAGSTVASSSNSLQLGGTVASSFLQITGSANGAYVGTSGTANSVSKNVIFASKIPGIYGDYVPNTSGTDTGHDDQTVVQNAITSGSGNLLFIQDVSMSVDNLKLPAGTEYWITLGNVLRRRSAAQYYVGVIQNANPRWVNTSGSANTATTQEASGIVDHDIYIHGGFIDANRAGLTGTNSWPIGYGNASTFGTGEFPATLYFSGVKGLRVEDVTLFNPVKFHTIIGNVKDATFKNVVTTKPNLYLGLPALTGSATAYATDDAFHLRGSCYRIRFWNCGALYNSDDSFALNAGELQSPSNYESDPIADVGPIQDVKGFGLYTNGGGFRLLPWVGATIASPISDVLFDGVTLAAADAAQTGYVSAFVTLQSGRVSNFTLANANIEDRYLGSASQQILISGSNLAFHNIFVNNYRGPSVSNQNGFITIGSGTSSDIRVDGVIMDGTSARTGALVDLQSTTTLDKISVSNSVVKHVNFGIWNESASFVQSLGGAGNVFADFTELTSGSFSETSGDFLNPVYRVRASNFSDRASVFASTYRDQFVAFCQGLQNEGPYATGTNADGTTLWDHILFVPLRAGQNYLAISGSNVANGDVKFAGGLYASLGTPTLGGTMTWTGTGGNFAYNSGYGIGTTIPATLTGSAAKCFVAVYEFPDQSGFRNMGGFGSSTSTGLHLYNGNGSSGAAQTLYYPSGAADLTSGAPVLNGTFAMAFASYAPVVTGTYPATAYLRVKASGVDNTVSGGTVPYTTQSTDNIGINSSTGIASAAGSIIPFVAVFDYNPTTSQQTAFYNLYANTLGTGLGLASNPYTVGVSGTASASVNFGIVASGVSATQFVTCAGANPGDLVQIGLPSDGGMGIQKAWIATSGTISINSFAAVALTSTSQTYNFIVWRKP